MMSLNVVPIWIDHPDQLSERLAILPTRIALDTEFVRERTYWPQLALIQVAFPNRNPDQLPDENDIYLIDPTSEAMYEAVVSLLQHPSLLKIMHSPSEDLVALHHHYHVLPTPIFDTQAAAAIAGMGAGLGYQRLVAELTQIELGKGETRTNWLQRPLTPAQVRYAADDVRYLFKVHDALTTSLQTLQRNEWAQEESARALHDASKAQDKIWPTLSPHAAKHLDKEAQLRYFRLYRWREQQAIAQDLPRSWIVPNELVQLLAQSPPESVEQLKTLLSTADKRPRAKLSDILTALSTPLADEAQAPVVEFDKATQTLLKSLQTEVTRVASHVHIPETVLASRRMLEALIKSVNAMHHQWPIHMNGWRRALLEPGFAPLLLDYAASIKTVGP